MTDLSLADEGLIVAVDDPCRQEAFKITAGLRDEGIPCDMDHSGRSLNGGVRKANREKRKYVVLIGEDELSKGEVLLKDMETGEQENIAVEELIERLKKHDQNT